MWVGRMGDFKIWKQLYSKIVPLTVVQTSTPNGSRQEIRLNFPNLIWNLFETRMCQRLWRVSVSANAFIHIFPIFLFR